MTTKAKIFSESRDPERPYSHLIPVVEKLLELGNELAHSQMFYLSQDGWRCDLKRPINFAAIRENFELPDSIELGEANNTIWCRKSWVEVQGGFGADG